MPSRADSCIRGRVARRIRSTSSSVTSPVRRHGSIPASKQPSTFHRLPMPAMTRWSSSASPIGRVGSSVRSRRRNACSSSSGARMSGPRPAIRWSKRVRLSVISSSTGPLIWATSLSPLRMISHVLRGVGQSGVAHAPLAGHPQVRVDHERVLEADEQVLAVGVDAPSPPGPAAARGQRSRPKRGCGVSIASGHAALQHRPDPVRRVVDGVAFRHCSEYGPRRDDARPSPHRQRCVSEGSSGRSR